MVITLWIAQKAQKIFCQYLKIIIQFSKETAGIIDKRVNFQYMSSLFHFHITHYCKWKYQPIFMSEPHSFTSCNHNLGT